MANDPVQKAAPRALYYLAIDGTSAIDSVAYGELLEGSKHGWRNLVGDFLAPAADDANRLHDPAHPWLPICVYKGKTRSGKVAVVCPGGREGLGKDPFWQAYAGEDLTEKPSGKVTWPSGAVTFGRHTAHLRSTEFMGELMLIPAIEVVTKAGAEERRLFDARLLPDTRDGGITIDADLLIISSHGWLGGYMAGDNIRQWPDAEPAEAREETGGTYFLVGDAAEQARGFSGPRWIILAQCSTVNRATWPLWTRVLSNSVPAVRGILAYEEVSPAAAGSIPIARKFLANCESMPIVEAWKKANAGKKWAAIVHQDAVNDRMADWRNFVEPASTETTATTASYRGFLRSTADEGEPILDLPPPFELRLESINPPDKSPDDPDADWARVTPDTLNRGRAKLVGGRWHRLGVVAPGEHKAVSAEVTWVHIRTTHPKQFKAAALFQKVEPFPGQEHRVSVSIDASRPRVISLTSIGEPTFALAMAFQVQAATELGQKGVEAHHSYLWPQVSLTLDDGRVLKYDFMTTGLSYVG